MSPMKNDRSDLISICRNQYRGNKFQLKIIREFEENYSDNNAIWWWTRETFLSKLFNKAWKKRNLDLIFLFRFFLHDLEKQLQEYQCFTSIKVYRYQLISKIEFELFKQSIGQFISINNFLLATTHCDTVLPSFIPNDYQLILFEIIADFNPEKIKAFGNIISQKYIQNEVLFMLGSIFQLKNIRQHDNDLSIIEMTLTSRTNPHLKPAFDALKKNQDDDDDDEINLLSFGYILQKMNLTNETEKFYNRLFIELPDDDERLGCCYLNLSNISYLKHDYDSSLEWLLKSLDISIRTLEPNDKFLAIIYNSMGQVYYARNDLKLAIESYDKAMIIWKQSINENYLNIVECLNQIAMIYKYDKDYLLTLKYLEKILILLEKYLPNDHLDRSKIHWNIASTYRQLEQYDFALEHYNLSFKILEKYYPSDHPNIAKALGNIGIVYALKNDPQNALIYYEKVAEIYRHTFPSTHTNNIKINQLIQNISSPPHRNISFGLIESK
jgi:tetratricopeptide (TPR) repeat protein